MAIQMRRGMKVDFDPDKMLAGEWAVSIDPQTENQWVWMCFAPGFVKRMGTWEDLRADIQPFVDAAAGSAVEAKSSEDKAKESETRAKESELRAKESEINSHSSYELIQDALEEDIPEFIIENGHLKYQGGRFNWKVENGHLLWQVQA